MFGTALVRRHPERSCSCGSGSRMCHLEGPQVRPDGPGTEDEPIRKQGHSPREGADTNMKMIWTDALKQEIANGYIKIQHHPTLPLRIFSYTHKATIDERWSTEICFCRGLIIDDTDEVIARPQPKFFNLGQTVDIVGQG